jgi:hypothetical protein
LERQHCVPILLPSSSDGAKPLKLVAQQGGSDAVSEAYIQALVHQHPACLPVAEIDAMFLGPVPICTELNTPAGPIDNFMVTPSGLPVLVECKLWRNLEARREVVSQILDYAKELSRWSSSDMQREVRHRLKRDGNTPGAYAMQAVVDEWKAGGAVKDQLGGTVKLSKTAGSSVDSIIDTLQVGSLEHPEVRKRAFSWLAERVNTFVNVLRPRIRSAAADYQSRAE